MAGFRRSITRVFKSYGEKEGMFEKAKVEIEGDDFREGLRDRKSTRLNSSHG